MHKVMQTVTVLGSGGSTDPTAGTYTYNDGTSITFTATQKLEQMYRLPFHFGLSLAMERQE